MALWLDPTQDSFTHKSGAYIQGSLSVSTSVTLGNGNLRLCPLWFNTPVGITAIGAEFTVAGDAASLFRMTLYNDDGSGYPGVLALDGGSISTGTGNAGTVATAGTPGVYLNTLGSTTYLAAGLYWVGGAVQGVTTTQPTIRTGLYSPQFNSITNAVPAVGTITTGYLSGGVTGTPPNPYAVFASSSSSGTIPRVLLRLA